MMNRVAMRLIEKTPWGTKARLFIGAALSTLDMITDIATIVAFLRNGETAFAYANIAFTTASLFMQLIAVYAQNHERGVNILCYEAMLCVLMLKPATDALRVAAGNVHREGCTMDPQKELTVTKW